METEPDNGAYLDSLGWYYYKTNHFDDALTQLQQAVEKLKHEDHEDAVVYEHLGDTYLKLSDSAKALDAWQKAMELDPQNPDAAAITKKISDAKGVPAAVPSPTPPKG